MFQTSTPVVGKGFQNREAELNILERAFQRLVAGQPHWLAILGRRKIGKSSLVLEAGRRAQSNSLRVITLDAQEQGPVSLEIFRRLALRTVDAVLGGVLGESLERLAGQAARYRESLLQSKHFDKLPPPLRFAVLELAEGKAEPERIGTWLDLPEQLAAIFGLWLVIALDEFQELEGLKSPKKSFDPFMLMRSRWQKHGRVAYIISGSARSMLMALIHSQHSPFYQHFAVRELDPFSHQAAVDLLRQLSPPAHPIPLEVAELAAATLGGHPFYLQMLGEQLTEQPRPIDRAALKEAMQELLFSRAGRLALFFENEFQRLVGKSTFLAATLNALAEGPSTLTAVSRSIQALSGATANYLDRLGDAVTRREDGNYQLTDETFALWLRWRRPGGTVLPMSLVGDEAEKAVAQALSQMGFDLVYQSKASRGAFDLLATRGAAQLGLQVKRSPLPLRFKRSDWSRLQAEGHRLCWRWVVAAVSPENRIQILDPAKALVRREVTLRQDAEIPNVLLWIDSQKG